MDDYDNYYEEEYDDESFKIASEFLNNTVLKNVDNEVCEHKDICKFPDGTGYCRDCSLEISDVYDCCSHKTVIEDDNGLTVCQQCGIEIEKLDFKPEWRWYYDSDNRSAKDPSRCQQGANNNKTTTLDKIFQRKKIEVNDLIKKFIYIRYKKIIAHEKSNKRGKEAEAIICVCHMYVLRDFGEYRTPDHMRGLYGLSRNNMSDGITIYLIVFPEERTKTTKPEDLIRWIMRRTGVDTEHYAKIIRLCRYFDNTSVSLKRSSPQSVASTYVYLYLCLNPEYKNSLGLTKSKFASKVGLSDITITKLVKEAISVGNLKVNI